MPDPRLALAWLIPEQEWRSELEDDGRDPEWKPEEWDRARQMFAFVLLNAEGLVHAICRRRPGQWPADAGAPDDGRIRGSASRCGYLPLRRL